LGVSWEDLGGYDGLCLCIENAGLKNENVIKH
jgi:hypothetical protein